MFYFPVRFDGKLNTNLSYLCRRALCNDVTEAKSHTAKCVSYTKHQAVIGHALVQAVRCVYGG